MAFRTLIRQGVNVTYTTVTTSAYNVNTGIAANTESSVTVKAYPKHIIANQYNYPNLIGKTLREFYIAGNALASPPKSTDKIVYNSDTYTVSSLREHIGDGQVCLYCILAVKQ